MQSGQIQTLLGAGAGGAEAVVVFVVLLTGKAGGNIGRCRLVIAALQVVQYDRQGIRYLIVCGPGAELFLPVARRSVRCTDAACRECSPSQLSGSGSQIKWALLAPARAKSARQGLSPSRKSLSAKCMARASSMLLKSPCTAAAWSGPTPLTSHTFLPKPSYIIGPIGASCSSSASENGFVDGTVQHHVGAESRANPGDVIRVAPAGVHADPAQPVVEGVLQDKTAGALQRCVGDDCALPESGR